MREKKPTAVYDRALTESTPQGSCDSDLIEIISKWLEKSEDSAHCNGFRDISIAGLRTRHQRIQCIINCKHEIQQGSCSLKTHSSPPCKYSVALSGPQEINLLFSHGLQIQEELRECASRLFSASLVEVGEHTLARLAFPHCSPASPYEQPTQNAS